MDFFFKLNKKHIAIYRLWALVVDEIINLSIYNFGM